MSLCFKEAFSAVRNGTIEEAEYLRHLLAHFRCIRHPSDVPKQGIEPSIAKHNPYAASIQDSSLNSNYQPFEAEAPLEDLFASCLDDNNSRVKEHLEILAQSENHSVLLQSLGTLAAEKGHSSTLQMCLDRGISFDHHLDRAVEIGFFQSPGMLEVLSAAKWRNIQDAKDDQLAIDEIVRPWLKTKIRPEEHAKEEMYKERHERLMKIGAHPPGTCKTSEELAKSFDHINW